MLTQFSNCSSKTEMEVNDESNGLILFSESMVPVKLKSQKKEVSDFRLPIRIKKIDEYLFITDLKRDKGMVAIYDLINDRYLRSIIPKGNGPSELSAVSSIVGGNDGRIYFYDLQSLRLLEADLNKLITDSLVQPVYSKRIISDDYEKPLRIVNASDTSFIAYSVPGIKGRFSFLDRNFGFTGHQFGEYPPLEKTGEAHDMAQVPFYAQVLGNIYSSSISTLPSNNFFIVAHHNVDLIEIYDYKSGQRLKRIIGPDQNFPPAYVINSGGQGAPCLECRCGYSSPQITSRYYAFLRLHKLYKEADAYLSRYIYLFDFEGRLISVLELDAEISEFVIDEQRKKIYAIAFDEDSVLLSYDLPV